MALHSQRYGLMPFSCNEEYLACFLLVVGNVTVRFHLYRGKPSTFMNRMIARIHAPQSAASGSDASGVSVVIPKGSKRRCQMQFWVPLIRSG
jgi:hypothetical protein